jgi:thiamine biosynthesis lipoprotein
VAARAWEAVRAELDAVDRSLSRFRDDSELTHLNRLAGSGTVIPVSRRLRVALALADRAGRVTAGRFDASVLETLERIGERGARLEDRPVAADMPDLPGLAGGAVAVPMSERTRRAHVPPVPLDLGGVGKGLALRWAAEAALPELPGGSGMLLDAGGDIIAAGVPPDGGWRIGVEDPAGDSAAGLSAAGLAQPAGSTASAGSVASVGSTGSDPLVVLELAHGAVATSSVRVRNWIGPDGRPVHHLVDPSTRAPARTGLLAVTVARSDPAWAEIWSKALFLAGRDAIAEEARGRGLAAWWVDDRGRLGMTPDARVRTLWAAEDRLG